MLNECFDISITNSLIAFVSLLIVIISSGCYFFEVIILCQTQYHELAIRYLFLIFHWPRGCCYYFDDTAAAAAAAAKSLQSYPTLCDPIEGRPPGTSVPGILQTRALEWVAISFSSA